MQNYDPRYVRNAPMLDDDGAEESLTPAMWANIARERRPKIPLTTDWFAGDVAPVHIGWYERHFVDSVENLSERRMHYWDGAPWRRTPNAQIHHLQVGHYPAWRGLEIPSENESLIGLHWDLSGVWVDATKSV